MNTHHQISLTEDAFMALLARASQRAGWRPDGRFDAATGMYLVPIDPVVHTALRCHAQHLGMSVSDAVLLACGRVS